MIAARAAMLASGVSGEKNADHPMAFGITGEGAVTVQSYEFQGMDPFNDHIADDGNSYRYFSAAGSGFLVAPVYGVPSGAIIDFVSMSDISNGNGDLFLGLWDDGYGAGFPCGVCNGGGNITFLSSISGGGEDFIGNLNAPYNQNYGHPLYLLLLWGTHFDGSTKFNAVTIGYHRTVSPAPGTPTFNDVQPGDFGFQFIEALAASGITGGCQVSPPLYCPNDNLTRAQMAVFLAKALGLHWTN